MSREFAEVVGARYKEDDMVLKEILPLAEQRAFVEHLDTKRTGYEPKKIDDEKGGRDFEGPFTAKEVATTGVCRKLRTVQHICEKGGEAVSATVVTVPELAS